MEKQPLLGQARSRGLPLPLVCRPASLADAWTVTSIFIRGFGSDQMSHWVSLLALRSPTVEVQELLHAVDHPT